jgi:hypothetical protein
MVAKTSPETAQETTADLTCKGCTSLVGDVHKDEAKKLSAIHMYCLRNMKLIGHEKSLLKIYEVAGLSLEGSKMPKYDEYPQACESHSSLRDSAKVEEIRAKLAAEDEEDIETEDTEDQENGDGD